MNKQIINPSVREKRKFLFKHLLPEAKKLGIKCEFIHTEEKDVYHRLSYQSREVYLKNAALYENTDKFSSRLAGNKDLVKTILGRRGIKIPRGFTVTKFSQIKPSLKKYKIDFPLVLKPGYAACGYGVFVNLTNWTDLQKAFQEAHKIPHKFKDKPIVIEEYFYARDFRLLILDGRFISAIERVHPHIQGDGRSTISQLIKRYPKTLKGKRMAIDWEIKRNLKKQDFSLSTILPEGQIVRLRENANTSTGGYFIHCTKEVCSRFKKIAETCAQEFNINLCGVDLLTSDISNPKADYRIIEINESPAYYNGHESDSQGELITQMILKSILNIK